MSVGFDVSELDDFTRDLLSLAKDKLPNESKKFIRTEQGKFRTRVRRKTRESVKMKTGTLYDSIDRSQVIVKQNGVYGNVHIGAPHAHLIEDGHRIVGHEPNKKDTGKKTKSYKIMENAKEEFNPIFVEDCEQFVDKMLKEKGL